MIRIKFPFKLVLAAFVIICFTQGIRAQESIATARPTLSIGSMVLPEHSFQWEQGAQYSDIDGDEWAYDALLRISMSNFAEVRILIPTLEDRLALLEMKWTMIHPNGSKPGIGFSLTMGTKDNQEETGESFKILGYRVAIEKYLTDGLTAMVNTGYASDGYFGDLTLAYSLSKKFTVVGEYWHHQEWKQIQSGITYLINSETQIDINGGLLFDTENSYTVGFGIARRFIYRESDQ